MKNSNDDTRIDAGPKACSDAVPALVMVPGIPRPCVEADAPDRGTLHA